LYEVWGIYWWSLGGWTNHSQEWVRGDEALYKPIETKNREELNRGLNKIIISLKWRQVFPEVW
jgi:hypothetical protein